MKVCEHEYENANCANCANGLPFSGYECAKTKGTLKEYCHAKAEEIHRLKYNEGYEQGYDQGRAEVIYEIIETLPTIIVDDDGIMHRVVEVSNIEQLKEQNK